jgi:S1/P1 Nuclease
MHISAKLICYSLFCVSSSCYAWGPEGHAIVGAIADANLSAVAKTRVTQLLQGDLDAAGMPSGRRNLAAVASWPDEIKATVEGKAAANWHFHESTVCDGQTAACVSGACADEKINDMLRQLNSVEASARQKNEALKWLVHLVGDIHQPLHVGGNADRGGNAVKVSLARAGGVETGLNLHSVWDNQLAKLVLDDAEMAAKLKSAVLPADFAPGTTAQWMSEGQQLVKSTVYTFSGFACGTALASEPILLSSEYQAAAKKVIFPQLLSAGLRLAAILNQTLK